MLKAMSDYLASQTNVVAAVDSDIEVITPDLQKIQFTSSTEVVLSRPDKLRASRVGGYTEVELVFNGKTLSIFGKNLNAYAEVDAAGSIDQLIDRLRSQTSMEVPGADLLLAKAYDQLSEGVLDAKHIGVGVINGVECEHLAFRNEETDWQLWIQAGPRPIPCKYVITSKTVAGAPQYTLRIKEWKTDVAPAADAFVFKPPADARKVDIVAIDQIDEVPQGTVIARGVK
jgi:hypothetical protein